MLYKKKKDECSLITDYDVGTSDKTLLEVSVFKIILITSDIYNWSTKEGGENHVANYYTQGAKIEV